MHARDLLIGLGAAWLAGAAAAGPVHEHGVARLDVAVDPGRVVLALETPLDNLLGFEHAPRTDAERAKVAAVVDRLRAADGLFRIDAAAGCTLARVVLEAPTLGLGRSEAPVAGKEGHGDLDAQFEFTCKAGARPGFVEHGLFEAFAPLKRLDLQVATPKGQMKATLRRPQSRLALAR